MNKPDMRSPVEREMAVGLMGGISIWHWVVVGAVVLLLFGRGKISEVMGDVAKGIKSFKRGLAEDDTEPNRSIERTAAEPAMAPAPARDEQPKPG